MLIQTKILMKIPNEGWVQLDIDEKIIQNIELLRQDFANRI